MSSELGDSVHPSPSASDGLVIDQSFSIKKADRLDQIIECAQCGFMVDLRKRSTGDSLGAITPSATLLTGTVVPSGKPVPPPYVSWTDTFSDVVDTQSGCPFCNSMNPQGRIRNRSFGSGIDIQNL